jgi:transposase, IS5 family
MRKIIEKQLKFGQVDIDKIEIDLKSRDEIPQLLLGLQALYRDTALREKIFSILERIVPQDTSKETGRPGMDLWKILVLGTIRLNCNFDYDKLLEITNEHRKVREFMGHIDFEEQYALQTVRDNVALLTPEVMNQVGRLVIEKGHKMFGKKDQELSGRCDSFVVETNVHFPTDINLLWDAMRKMVTLITMLFSDLGLTQWRQSEYILRKIKKLFNKANKLKRSKNKEASDIAHRTYIDTAAGYVLRVRRDMEILRGMGCENIIRMAVIEQYIAHAERQIDQIRRRVLNDETISHQEKVFSIFEPHTEWISKGKLGVPQELGLKVCILEDQHGFILHHQVMEKQTDEQIAVNMVSAAKERFPGLSSCSFDKGFHSPRTQKDLAGILDKVILPRKGRLSAEAEAIEYEEAFIRARRRHSAVESAINALENHALDRCPDHGLEGFKRYVSLAVLARNIQILGAKIQRREQERLRREEEADLKRFRRAA